MKTILLVLLIAFSYNANALEVCVAPIAKSTLGERNLSNPTGRIKPYDLSVHIQGHVITQGLLDSDCFDYSADKSIKVVVKDNGKAIESFFVVPSKYSDGACVWFKSLYDTWSVWKLEESKHLCSNRTEQGAIKDVNNNTAF